MASTFGFPSILKATPLVVRRIRDAVVYAVSGSLVSAPVLARKFGMTIEDYSMWCGLIILGVCSFCMLFGVPPKEADTFRISAPKDEQIINS